MHQKYTLRAIPDGAPESVSGTDLTRPLAPAPSYFTAAIYREDGSWVFRFKPEQLKTLVGKGMSEAEEIVAALNVPPLS
jgi:hypothetical protein